MRQIEETVQLPPYDRGAWRFYTEGLATAVLDIETTGLSSSRDALVLGGLFSPGTPGSLRQYLAATPGEERELLSSYMKDLSSADVWITYNGDTFDRPFLARRLFKNGMGEELPLHQSLDLYRLFRRYSPMAKLLPDLKQTTLEEALGLSRHRRDGITGRESAELYGEYARRGEQELEQAILLHNHDDLLMLARLMAILDKLDLHRIMFQQGFMVGYGGKRILLEKITLGKNFLRAEGRTGNVGGDYDVFSDACHWAHRQAGRTFTLSLPCLYERGLTFVDLEALEYDFAPLSQSPSFVSGYLLFHDGYSVSCREVNYTIKIILTEILKKI